MGGTARPSWAAILVAVISAVCAGMAVGAVQHSPRLRGAEHIRICHALGNGGWILIEPSVAGVLSGHEGHPRDIIPPFDYELNGREGHFPGLNWTGGQTTWENGCVRPAPPPGQIRVFVTCVDAGASTYDARFGYQSANDGNVSIAVGSDNGFSPAPEDRGQATVFLPGEVGSAFNVNNIPVGTPLTWTVSYGGHTSTATASSTFGVSCTTPPPPHVGVFVRCVSNHGDRFDATFGYQNDGSTSYGIPVGADNRFSPAPEGRGQTTDFLPGNVQDAFTVKDIPAAEQLVWSLKSDTTATATATAGFDTKCSEPPPPVRPIGVFVTCVAHHGPTYDAVFGYESDNLVDRVVPIGEANTFSPGPGSRGQPTVFSPGRIENAVTVTGIPDSTALTWTLVSDGTRSATATTSAPACAGPPEPPRPFGIFATCVVNHGGTYDAVFGYLNGSVGDVLIPIGSSNVISPGPAGQGQPDTFQPGFVNTAFAVRGLDAAQPVSWRLTLGHDVLVATATAEHTPKCLTAPINPISDLGLSKSLGAKTARVGQQVDFTIVARNRGSKVLAPATVADSLFGSRLTILSVTTTRGRCRIVTIAGSHRLLCTARMLAPGESIIIRVRALASAAGTASDRATILGVHDVTPRDNSAGATLHILPPPPPPPGRG